MSDITQFGIGVVMGTGESEPVTGLVVGHVLSAILQRRTVAGYPAGPGLPEAKWRTCGST
jgi:hypothetical protein